MQREGRWALDAYKSYVRVHNKDAGWAARVMACDRLRNCIQPGKGIQPGLACPPLVLGERK